MKSITNRGKTDEATQSERPQSVFARYFPQLKSSRRRALINDLLAESKKYEEEAAKWEKRGHYERTGHYKERAAAHIRRVMDIKISQELITKYGNLMKDAFISYSVEIGDAGRYDPGIEYRMYLTARGMGDAKRADKSYKAMFKGFGLMITDPNLDNLVRLNRIKRDLIAEIWEGNDEAVFRLANDAIDLAKSIKSDDGKANRGNDTLEWIKNQFAAKYGDAYRLLAAIFGESQLE